MEVVVRVLGLFITDYCCKNFFKLLPSSMEIGEIVNCVLANLVWLHGFLLWLLPFSLVRALHRRFVRGSIIIIYHAVSEFYIRAETNLKDENDPYFLGRQIAMLIFYGLLGGLIFYLQKVRWRSTKNMRKERMKKVRSRSSLNNILPVFPVYAFPVIARMANMPLDTLPFFHNLCNAATAFNVFLYVTYEIPTILNLAKVAIIDVSRVFEAYEQGAISGLAIFVWNNLLIRTHFVLFLWIEFFVNIIGNTYFEKLPLADGWYIIIITSVSSSICSTPVTLIATFVSLKYFSDFTLLLMMAYTQGYSAFVNSDVRYFGWAKSSTLSLLSILTVLINAKMYARMPVMQAILFSVLSCLLILMLGLAEYVVMNIRHTSRNRSFCQRLRAVGLCLALTIFPFYQLHLVEKLTAVFPMHLWIFLYALSSFSNFGYFLASLKVFEILIVHTFLLYDIDSDETWKILEDIVYYLKVVIHVIQFLISFYFHVLFLCWSIYEEWSWWIAFSLLLLFLHISAHFCLNVCLPLKAGWESFLLRRKVAEKAKYLPSASKEQLVQLDDVCSICFGTMTTACITPCQHFFHRTCLMKWLSGQERCPICHSVVSLSDSEMDSDYEPELSDSETESDNETELSDNETEHSDNETELSDSETEHSDNETEDSTNTES